MLNPSGISPQIQRLVAEAFAQGQAGNAHQSIEIFRRAMLQASSNDDLSFICSAENNLALHSLSAERHPEAANYLQEILDPTRRLNIPDKLALVLMNLGIVCRTLERLDDAKRCFEEAHSLGHQIGEKRIEIGALAQLSLVAVSEGQSLPTVFDLVNDVWGKREFLQPDLRQVIMDVRASMLIPMASIFRTTDNPYGALKLLEEALTISGIGQTERRISNLITIGNIYLELKNYVSAISSYEEAVNLLRGSSNLEALATALNNLGVAKGFSEPDITEAEDVLREASSIRRNLALFGLAGDSLSNLLTVLEAKHNHEKAILCAREARELYKIANFEEKEAHCLYQMAKLYFNQEDNEQAYRMIEEFEALVEGSGPSEDLLGFLLLKAQLAFKEGKYESSLNSNIEAAILAKRLNTPMHGFQALLGLGASLVAERRIAEARELYISILGETSNDKIRQLNLYRRVTSLIGLGVCSIIQKDLREANRLFKSAADEVESHHQKASYFTDFSMKDLEMCLYVVGRIRSRNSSFVAELNRTEEAAAPNLLELLVTTPGFRRLQGDYLLCDARAFWDAYNILTEEVQLKQGLDLEAFYTIERAQTRTYAIEVLSRHFAGPISMPYGSTFTLMGVGIDSGSLSLSQMMAWSETCPGTAVVKFFVGRQTGAAWVIFSSDESDIRKVSLPGLNQGVLNSLLVQKWYGPHQKYDQARKLRDPWEIKEADQKLKSSMDELLRELYDQLFLASDEGKQSVLDILREVKAQQIILVPHLGLLNIPLHATFNSYREYLCDQFEIFYSPSVRLLYHCLELKRTWDDDILVVSNPDGTLQGTDKELNGILPLFNRPIVMKEGNAFRDSVMSSLLNVHAAHFSCHAMFSKKGMDYTGLVLSDKQLLSVSHLMPDGQSFHQKPYNHHLRCVFLAACETAVGESNPQNELASLAMGFMAIGSPTVIASLWKVHDESTAELVTHFYNNIRKSKMSIGTALHEAQKRVRCDSRWEHPYYWAPFQLIGSWDEFTSQKSADNASTSFPRSAEDMLSSIAAQGIHETRVSLNLFSQSLPTTGSEGLPMLMGILSDTKRKAVEREKAAQKLGEFNTPAVIEALISQVKNPPGRTLGEYRVTLASVESLEKMGTPQALNVAKAWRVEKNKPK